MKFQYLLQDPDFRVGNIDVQTVSRPKNYRHSFLGGREKHGFVYVVNGKMLDSFVGCSVDDLPSYKGELVFIPKGSRYTGAYMEENTIIKIIQFDILSGELPEYLSTPVKLNLPNAYELVEAFFSPIENHTAYHPFYYLSCLYGLLWKIDESYSRLPHKYKKLQPALTEMVGNWNENRKVSYYAELCDMSETNFRRLFGEYMGMSPIDYRNDIRLINAKAMLQSGEYNVSEVAFESGFSNLSFFIRLYKKKYGHTPKQD